MSCELNCAAVIPCLNEARTVGALCAAVRRFLPRVFVVDDGSTDRTADVAAAAGAHVVRNAANLGKGAAIRNGIIAARRAGFSRVILMDGDGQHDPADIPVFLECANKTDAALIVGNRMNDAGRMPWLRRAVNRWMSRRISGRTGLEMPDTQCGFRLVCVRAWDLLETHTNHYEIESEMLFKAAELGLNVRFLPIRVIGRGPRSGIRPVLDTLRWLKWWCGAQPAGSDCGQTVEANI